MSFPIKDRLMLEGCLLNLISPVILILSMLMGQAEYSSYMNLS